MSKCTIFFFNDTATTEIYTLSLHDALPISSGGRSSFISAPSIQVRTACCKRAGEEEMMNDERSEEHTSELQSLTNLVCRLLLEKKKKKKEKNQKRHNHMSEHVKHLYQQHKT